MNSERRRRLDHSRRQRLAHEAKTAATPPPRKDAAKEMLRGTGLDNAVDVLRDPLFQPAERTAEREAALQAIATWRSAGPFAEAHDYTVSFNGEQHTAADFVAWQDKAIYTLLARGINPRAIQAYCHATAADVADVARRHDIHLN